jgi:hypothetical protein
MRPPDGTLLECGTPYGWRGRSVKLVGRRPAYTGRNSRSRGLPWMVLIRASVAQDVRRSSVSRAATAARRPSAVRSSPARDAMATLIAMYGGDNPESLPEGSSASKGQAASTRRGSAIGGPLGSGRGEAMPVLLGEIATPSQRRRSSISRSGQELPNVSSTGLKDGRRQTTGGLSPRQGGRRGSSNLIKDSLTATR